MDKKIKRQAEKQLYRYRNEEFLQKLKEKQLDEKKPNEKRRRLMRICLPIVSAAVTTAVVLLCVFLIKPAMVAQTSERPEGDVPEKIYSEENLQVIEETLEKLNAEMQDIAFQGADECFSIQRCVDGKYLETLYYFVTYTNEDDLIQADFTVIVNPDYKKEEETYDKEGTVASFPLVYWENSECEDDLYFFTESGVIKTNKERVFVTAEITAFESEGNFVGLLNDVITKK